MSAQNKVIELRGYIDVRGYAVEMRLQDNSVCMVMFLDEVGQKQLGELVTERKPFFFQGNPLR